MEQTLRTRIELRREELQGLLNQAESLRTKLGSVGANVQEFTEVRIKLKSSLEAYDKECLRVCEYLDHTEHEQYFRVQMSAEKLLADFDVVTELNKNTKANNVTTKLPKLQLTKFNGDIQKWPEFWAKFDNSINKQDLSDTDKLTYLFTSLEGIALEALRGIDITNDNYQMAVEILQKRFGNKDLVIDAHYDALNKLERASENNTRSILDAINKHLRILKTLGENTEGNFFRNIVYNKFPQNILYELNLLMPNEKKLDNILETLERIVQAKERAKDAYIAPSSAASSTEALHVKTVDRKQVKRKPSERKEFKNIKRSRRSCSFCGNDHFDDQCHKFKTTLLRRKQLTTKRLCFKCFQAGHVSRRCPSQLTCFYCKGNHNRALCDSRKDTSRVNKRGDKSASKNRLDNQGNDHIQYEEGNLSKVLQVNATSYLQTATAQLQHENRRVPLRLLLDCGSQRSYLTENIAKQLNIIPDSHDQLVIYTFGSNTPQERTSPSAEINLVTKRGIEKKMRVNIVPHITDKVSISHLVAGDEIDVLADDDSLGERIDMLIGNDYYFSFLKNQSMEIQENLHLINTDLGWIVSGQLLEDKGAIGELSVVTYCQCHGSDCPYFTEPDLPLRNVDMRFLWSLESLGIVDSPKATREEEAVKSFNETVMFKDGRYEVKWPWIEYPPALPTNFGLAFGRLKSLLKRADANTIKDYQEILEEQLRAGVIEVVEPQTSPVHQMDPPVHYLPHHMVHQEGKRGRLVYDASAKVKEERSLNECMYRGPSMLEDLTALLIQFRTGKIGITADVEKAFLQVGLQEQDRDVTRFLWVKNVEREPSEDNLLHYRFCRVPFGVISSPFLLNATIRYHLSNTNGELLKKIASKCYVDNLVTEVNSLDEALHLYSQTRKVFEEISMNIRDWISNDKGFLESIPENFRAKQTRETKVLGLIWNVEEDTLRLKVSTKKDIESLKGRVTKKDVLRTLARVYDPCGFASPWILPIKLLFQETCTSKLKWDAALPDSMQQLWSSSTTHLQAVSNIELPRYINNTLHGTQCTHELHAFADASKNAYAAVIYFVARNEDKAATSFLMSKSRITPAEDKDDLKIPRLELLGFLIASRLLKYVADNLDVKIDRKILWTDSLIVLAWMRTSKLLPPFISRRVNEIKQHKDVEMRYVPTHQNPADIATRPDAIEQRTELWFSGPRFLKENEIDWPCQRSQDESVLFSAGEALDIVDGPEMSNKGYEDLEDVREIQIPEGDKDQRDCEQEELRNLQAKFFPEEVSGKPTNLVRNLGLFLDEVGLLRCKGRMLNTEWSYDMKHPILIPKDCEFTEKLIQKLHEENYHVGVPHTLSLVRRMYWIPQGRAKVQKVLKKCGQCIKHGGGPYKLPQTPALPAERANYSNPFTYTGMDYFGPVFVQTSSSGKEKRWICLFTCLAVRAIHLEVVRDLTAEEGLMSLKRFIATRGKPNLIVSDNATQFRLMSEILSGQELRWKFIPQLAPWHGGVYERLIGLVKNCLKRTLDKHLLQDGQLMTVIKEVEAVVNTRPLTNVGSDIEQVLRPADFLSLGRCVELQLPHEVDWEGTSTKTNLLRSWKRGQVILNEFKDMFQGQYLLSLRERYKHHSKQPRTTSDRQPCIGDVVQIKGDCKNRNSWKVGKISSLIKGTDGLCRVAKVTVGNQEFTRSIGHLYPLEADVEGQSITATPIRKRSEERVNRWEIPSQTETLPDVQVPSVVGNETPEQDDSKLDESVDRMEVESSIGLEDVSTPIVECEVETVEMEPVGGLSSELLEETEGSETPESRVRRQAAIRAREKIAEWTRHLLTVL